MGRSDRYILSRWVEQRGFIPVEVTLTIWIRAIGDLFDSLLTGRAARFVRACDRTPMTATVAPIFRIHSAKAFA